MNDGVSVCCVVNNVVEAEYVLMSVKMSLIST